MGISFVALTLPGSGPTPSEEILCPKKMVLAAPSSVLLGASLRLNLVGRSRNRRRSHTCYSPSLEKQTMPSMNSFTRSRPLQTPNIIDWNQPGEEASPCAITVHSHSPSWVHTAVRGIKSLSMAHWNNPLTKSVVLNTLEFPSSERRSSTTGRGRTGIMLCSLTFCSYTSTVYVQLISRRPPRD